jgi:maleylacetoacetate isomerase
MAAEPELILYDYWRSSAAYRVRIALHLKGLGFEQRAINLVRDGGEQHGADYRRLNPQGLVPALIHQGHVLTQSMAICEYLDEVFPAVPLLPTSVVNRARVRALALMVACDIHPINNLRVQQRLRQMLGAGEDAVVDWMNHWMSVGFAALEQRLQAEFPGAAYCASDSPGLADCFLVPQVYNAERYHCDLGAYPRIREITARCREHPAFVAAAPSSQPDAPRT